MANPLIPHFPPSPILLLIDLIMASVFGEGSIPKVIESVLLRQLLEAKDYDGLLKAIEQEGRGIIQVDWDGKIQFITGHALQLLDHFFGATTQNTNRLPLFLEKWLRIFQRTDQPASNDHPLTFVKKNSSLQIQILHSSRKKKPILLLKKIPAANESISPLHLSPREGEVLHWVAAGKTNQEIGILLGTVKKHLEHIYQEPGVKTRVAAAGILINKLNVFLTECIYNKIALCSLC